MMGAFVKASYTCRVSHSRVFINRSYVGPHVNRYCQDLLRSSWLRHGRGCLRSICYRRVAVLQC